MVTISEVLERLSYEILYLRTKPNPKRYKNARIYSKKDCDYDKSTLWIVKGNISNELIENGNACIVLSVKTDWPVEEYVVFPSDTDIDMLQKLLDMIFVDYNELQNCKYQLLACASETESIQCILDLLGEMLNNPVMTGDSAYNLVAYSGKDTKDAIFLDMLENGTQSPESFYFFQKTKSTTELLQKDEPIFYDAKPFSSLNRILVKILVDGKMLGILGVVEEYSPFTWRTHYIMKTAANALKLPYTKSYYNKDIFNEEHVFTDLLNGTISDKKVFEKQIKKVKVGVKEWCRLIVFEKNPNLDLGYIVNRDRFKRLLPNSIICKKENHLVIIISNKTKEKNNDDVTYFKDAMKNKESRFIVGRDFNDPLALPKQFMLLVSSMRIGKLFTRKNALELDENLIYGLLSECSFLQEACHPAILAFNKLEKEKRKMFTETLEQYVEQGCNIKKSAEALFIHRNTMAHRLEQIGELTGLNLEKGKDIFNAYLSIKILQILRETQSI